MPRLQDQRAANSQGWQGFPKELSLHASQMLSLLINNNCLFKKLVCGQRWRAPATGESSGSLLRSLRRLPFPTPFGPKDIFGLGLTFPSKPPGTPGSWTPQHPQHPATGARGMLRGAAAQALAAVEPGSRKVPLRPRFPVPDPVRKVGLEAAGGRRD